MLEGITILETSVATGPLAPFEISLATLIIKKCMVTAFPDTRQKMMKTISKFFIRLRSLMAKDIRRYDPTLAQSNPSLHTTRWAPLEPLYLFLEGLTTYAEENLYLEKPIEGAFPLFDVLKLIIDLFGSKECYINKAKQFEALNFIKKAKNGQLLRSKSLFMFLLNSMKATWTNVRINAFELLSKYDDEYVLFHDSSFVNGILIPTALDFLKDPRAMMAEACALMMKLVFIKCIEVADLTKFGELATNEFENVTDKRLAML